MISMETHSSPELTIPKTDDENTITCLKCGFEYKQSFKHCPNCGKKQKKKKSVLQSLLISLGRFLVCASLVTTGIALLWDSISDFINDTSAYSDTVAEEIVLTEDEYKAQCAAIPYKDIARNPTDYKGQKAFFKGKVAQVQENGKNVIIRIDVTQGSYGIWDDTVYIDYTRKNETESRILDEDIITAYGEILGIKKYTAVLGNQIAIPHLKAEYIVIH